MKEWKKEEERKKKERKKSKDWACDVNECRAPAARNKNAAYNTWHRRLWNSWRSAKLKEERAAFFHANFLFSLSFEDIRILFSSVQLMI